MSKKIEINLEHLELAYKLSYVSKYKDVIDFVQSSWNLSNLFLYYLDGTKKLDPKQKVSVYLIGKSIRLLRSITKLAVDGYLPEAEILHRALFESQILHAYILRDKSNSRANQWLNRQKSNEKWSVKEMLKDLDPSLYIAYSNLSLYSHSHIISVIQYVKIHENNDFEIEKGPIGGEENNNRSSKMLGQSALINTAICELSVKHFKLPQEWQKKHIDLMSLPYFQQLLPHTLELAQNKDFIKTISNFIETNE